jgi:nicotinamide-nucleotide amidase
VSSEKGVCYMVKKIIETLKERGHTITFAESCTGGRVASVFTSISGSSAVFNGSVITYSNEIKSKWLWVKGDTIIKYGAVSYECVDEMLNGVINSPMLMEL